ncbi:MAG: hypothetical protein COV45_03495 [Deltaproteobacteria bacterium CG11_big_fil_rev_8_21_14_0_20_47_16]|nr:MAG: hypothetical protein COV45_03495 [Deltaproteobacteria bacterium CG11_big_fil_rev_8_21_14_0_20_47_16]
MQNKCGFGMLVALVLLSACAKPLIQGKDQTTKSYEKTFSATPNQVYYAIRWALAADDYPVGHEDLVNGLISTSWVPTTPNSHYINPFDRTDPDTRDFGNFAGYYQLVLNVMPEGGKTRVVITSHVRTIVHEVKSSGYQEEDVFKKIGNYLRSDTPDVTNLGVEDYHE